MKRFLPVLLMILVGVMATVPGCESEISQPDTGPDSEAGQSTAADVPDETADAENGIHIFVQPDVRDVTVNSIGVPVTEDTFIPVQGGEAIVVTFSYPNAQGAMQEATVILDSYYRYFVIKNNGRYASSIYEETYLADQTSD